LQAVLPGPLQAQTQRLHLLQEPRGAWNDQACPSALARLGPAGHLPDMP